jgi:hypothetical protein
VGAGVVVAEPELEPELDALLEAEELPLLGAGVDDAVDAHEAEVGTLTPFALHKLDARLIMAGRLVSMRVVVADKVTDNSALASRNS